MPASITIELKNVSFHAQHGWHDEEAVLGNEFDVTVLATFEAPENITAINDTVDYAEVYQLVKTIFAEREKLLETVAEKIAKGIKDNFPKVEQLQLTITKLNPLISHFTGTVGITYNTDFK